MGIEQAWREGADNIATNLKRLMDWRRLVHGPGDRLEILRVERERINVTVPAHDIERMMRHRHAGPAWTVFHQNLSVLFLVDGIELGRRVKIALGIRRAHFNLAFAVHITLRDSDRAGGFEDQI